MLPIVVVDVKAPSDTVPATPLTISLHLTDNFTRFAKTFHHLQALFPSPNGEVTLLQQVVNFIGAVHVFEEFPLHLIFGVSGG